MLTTTQDNEEIIERIAALDITVTGSAVTTSATSVAGVTVAFKLAADLGSCGTCGLHTAVTNAAGTYSLTLPTGIYEALCAKTGQTCEVMTNPPTAGAEVTVDRNGSLNFLVAGPTPSPPPQPQPTPSPTGDGGNVVSGHMYYANGQPVANQNITFAAADCANCDSQPHVTTGADGSYSITLDDGTYQAQCDYIPGCGVQQQHRPRADRQRPARRHRKLHRLRAQRGTAVPVVPASLDTVPGRVR